MTIGVDRLLAELRSVGQAVDGPIASNGWRWVLIGKFEVIGGRFTGQIVQVAVPVPDDFPATPPGGFYVSPKIVPADQMAALNVHDRSNETAGIPGDWQYWSRPIPPGTWKPTNPSRRLITHWNAVMCNVN